MFLNKIYKLYFKRFFDLFLIFIFLPILIPLFLVVKLFVKIKIGSPIYFRQRRPGLNEEIFTIYKFRTMSEEQNENGLLSDKFRLNKFGKFLRSTSLDELPELWNVLKGEMSIVGPRPLLIEYLPLYSSEESARHKVRPGLTGWAQINGRNNISWKKKLELDIEYVENQSFLLDVKILFITIKKVITREGISKKNHVTIDKFKGNL